MVKSEKRLLWLWGISFLIGFWLWLNDFDERTKFYIIAGWVAFVLYERILRECMIIRRQNQLHFDLLWYMSFGKIEDYEREELKKRIEVLRKDCQ